MSVQMGLNSRKPTHAFAKFLLVFYKHTQTHSKYCFGFILVFLRILWYLYFFLFLFLSKFNFCRPLFFIFPHFSIVLRQNRGQVPHFDWEKFILLHFFRNFRAPRLFVFVLYQEFCEKKRHESE